MLSSSRGRLAVLAATAALSALLVPASADAFRAYRFKVTLSGTFESAGTVPGECAETASGNAYHPGTATSNIRFSTVSPWRMENVNGGSLAVPGRYPRLISTT